MMLNDPIYGVLEFKGPLLALLKTKPMQRLKKVHQGGAVFMAYSHITTTRFDHSVGVCEILRKLGCSLHQQVAGLLHDISHTAFSHVSDYVFENTKEDYHEGLKEKFLQDPEVCNILDEIKLPMSKLVDDSSWPALEAPLPFLCADRIDYTLRDMHAWNHISPCTAIRFLDSLVVGPEGKILVKSWEQAKWFKNLFKSLVEDYFDDPKATFANHGFAKVLKLALKEAVISESDFLKDDYSLLNQLKTSQNFRVRKSLDLFQEKLQFWNPDHNLGIIPQKKKRWVDPLVMLSVRDGFKNMPLSSFTI